MEKFFRLFISLFLLTSFSIATANCGSCTTGCYDPCNSCLTSYCDPCNSCYDCCDCHLNPCDGYPYLAYRSQGANAARELVGWQEFINLTDVCNNYAAFYAAFEYTRTFKPERIAQFYFGDDLVGCNTLLIQGSGVDDRNCKAWFADYFGLPTDFNSRVTFCPQIENFIVDLSYFHGLDKWREGAYIRIWAPIVHTRWNFCINEYVINEGEESFIAEYMAAEVVEREDLPRSFTEVMSGCVTFGDMKEPLRYGRISRCRLTETKLADIHVALGYNFMRKCDGHFGAHLYLGAPTGSRPCARCLFEPIVGNGKHWELGLGLTASWIFWEDECEENRYMGVFCDANLTHLFKTCQCRSFDYLCNPNSRYYLLCQMESNPADGDQIRAAINGTSPPPPVETEATKCQYAKCLVPAINRTTFNVDVKIPFQFDCAIKIACYRDNWSFDLGYNLWARTGEKFCYRNNCCYGPRGAYAAKGDAIIYGFPCAIMQDLTLCAEVNCEKPIPMSSSQHCANIHTGMNLALSKSKQITEMQARENKGIDNPANAYVEGSPDPIQLFRCTSGSTEEHLHTSYETILTSNLNMCKSPSAITHKLFAHINYTWEDACGCDSKWTPFLGLGVEAEFAPCKNSCCNNCCTCCNPCNGNWCGSDCNSCGDPCSKKHAGVNQWGVWLKGGVAYK